MYIENMTDKRLRFDWDNVSVNGFMVEPYFDNTHISAKNRMIYTLQFSMSDFEENNITEIEEMEYKFTVRDPEVWDDKLIDDIFIYKRDIS